MCTVRISRKTENPCSDGTGTTPQCLLLRKEPEFVMLGTCYVVACPLCPSFFMLCVLSVPCFALHERSRRGRASAGRQRRAPSRSQQVSAAAGADRGAALARGKARQRGPAVTAGRVTSPPVARLAGASPGTPRSLGVSSCSGHVPRLWA